MNERSDGEIADAEWMAEWEKISFKQFSQCGFVGNASEINLIW